MIDISKVTDPLGKVLIRACNLLFLAFLFLGMGLIFILLVGEPDLLDAIRNFIYQDPK